MVFARQGGRRARQSGCATWQGNNEEWGWDDSNYQLSEQNRRVDSKENVRPGFTCHLQVWLKRASREWRLEEWGRNKRLQDWNPNAAHLRHEGNESGCLKMQHQTDRAPPSENGTQTERPHFKDMKQTDFNQVRTRKKKEERSGSTLYFTQQHPLHH